MLRTIGAYQLLRTMPGRDREAYLARKGQRCYVLHLVDAAGEDVDALALQVQRSRALSDAAVVPIADAFEHEQLLALAVPASRGTDVQQLVDRLGERRLGDAAALHLARASLEAVWRMHALGLSCGLVTPRQLLLSWGGDVHVVGMGLAPLFRAAARLGALDAVARTYQAPELASGDPATPGADVYSIAVMLRSLLSGVAPRLDTQSLADRRPDLDPSLTRAIDTVLTQPAGERTSARELALRLAGATPPQGLRALARELGRLRETLHPAPIVPHAEALPPHALADRLSESSRPTLALLPAPLEDPIPSVEVNVIDASGEWSDDAERSSWEAALPATARTAPGCASRRLALVVALGSLLLGSGLTLVTLRRPHLELAHATVRARSGPARVEPAAAATAAPAAMTCAPSAVTDLPPAGYGYLVAHGPAEAIVYVRGKVLGRAGERLLLPCGLQHVRLGSVPRGNWYDQGRTVRVACGETTEIGDR